ncbi:MAG: methylated-DNA--[protein]-cysteine S-methyltransferase [Proteobacteria bacterium]|nr:methylated-DNA--[protein]-cysteine S-methyltransferase [Pseudomonadota bacterium]
MKLSAYSIFDTSLGPCGISWVEDDDPSSIPAVTCLHLPEATRKLTECKIVEKSCARKSSLPPLTITKVIRKVCRHLDGELQDFRDVVVEFPIASSFAQKVFGATRKIPAGKTATYGELAKALRCPAASRAVGQALGRNPIILIIPCHRVLAAGGKLGGFSAYGGLDTKSKLLSIEGASFKPHKPPRSGWKCVIKS